MVTVVIEDTIEMNNRDITSKAKTYQFKDSEAAQDFIDKLYEINQGKTAENLVRANIVDHNVQVFEDAVPLILHTVHYEHGANPTDGERFLEDLDVLTVEEIESFRKQGIKPGIVFAYDNPDSLEPSFEEELAENSNRFRTVFAYDNPDSLEPAIAEELAENSSRFDLLGANLFAEDENTTFHLSFRPDIADLLLEKYGDKEEFYAKQD